MRTILTFITVCLFGLLTIWSGCEDPNPVEIAPEDTLSFEERLAFEVDTINQYILESGYDSVFITESGLRIIPLMGGNGNLAKFGDILTIELTGSLFDDLVFETTDVDVVRSINFIGSGLTPKVRNLPADNTIAGVNEGLTYMDEGSSAIMLVPSHLAFGNSGSNFFRVSSFRVVKYEVTLRKIRR